MAGIFNALRGVSHSLVHYYQNYQTHQKRPPCSLNLVEEQETAAAKDACMPTWIKEDANSAAAGGVSAVVEQPFVAIKNLVLSKKGFSALFKHPMQLYRGGLVNILWGSAQLGTTNAMGQAAHATIDKEDKAKSLAAQALPGWTTGYVSGMVERISLEQFSQNKRFVQACRDLYAHGGLKNLIKGCPATALRDDVLLSCVLGTNTLKEKIRPYFKDDLTASVASGVLSGTLGTYGSQPLEAIKYFQHTMPGNVRPGMYAAMKGIFKKEGFKGFIKGALPRTAGSVATCIALSLLFDDKNKK